MANDGFMKRIIPFLAFAVLAFTARDSEGGIGFGATLTECRGAFGVANIFNQGTKNEYTRSYA
jgi:hypothetical protein